MIDRRRAFGGNGAILNPPAALFDPFSESPNPESFQKLFRFRTLESEYIQEELKNMSDGRRLFFSPLSMLNDFHEGLPRVLSDRKGLSIAQRKEIRVLGYGALSQSFDRSRFKANGLLPREDQSYFDNIAFLDVLLDRYLGDPVYKGVEKGQKECVDEAVRWIRQTLRVACFRETAPTNQHWAIYGNSGKGIFYEFEDRYDYAFKTFYTPKPIKYVECKAEITLFDIAVLLLFIKLHQNWSLSDLSFGSIGHPFYSALERFVFEKHVSFSGESEVRAIDFSGKRPGYVEVPGLYLKKIVLGPKCNLEHERILRQYLENANLSVGIGKAILTDGYDLLIEEI